MDIDTKQLNQSKMLADAIINEDLNKLNELITIKGVQLKDDDIFLVFLMAIRNKNNAILEILFNKLPIEKYINHLCEQDDVISLDFSIEQCPQFKRIFSLAYYNALQICAKFNSVTICAYLLINGANTNEKNTLGYNSLHTACFYSNIEIVELICGMGNIDINGQNGIQESALHIACKNIDNLDIVKVLINHGINVNLVNIFGVTAFSIACLFKAYDIVKYLHTQKFNLNLIVHENNPYVRKYKADHPDLFRN